MLLIVVCLKVTRREGGFLFKIGSRRKIRDGYITIRIYPDCPFYVMAHRKPEHQGKRHNTNGGARILEHRLIMAQHLGRCLERWEIVHHRNKIRDDNRIENLQIIVGVHQNMGFDQLVLEVRDLRFIIERQHELLESLREQIKTQRIPLEVLWSRDSILSDCVDNRY